MKHPFSSLYPFESRFQEIDGQKMHYLDEGEGEVLILLHGNPTWSFLFRNLIIDLKNNYRVIAPDYIGCGLSDHPINKVYRVDDRVFQVTTLMEKLSIGSYSLILHDWGGPIGTSVALKDISKVKCIVYFNTTLTEVNSLPNFIKSAASKSIGKFLTQDTMYFLKLMTNWGVVRKLPEEVKRCYYYPYLTKERRKAIWDFVSDIPFTEQHPSYQNLLNIGKNLHKLKNTPIKIIWGLKDPCFHKDMLDKIASHFPHASIYEIKDASHLVLEDAPQLSSFQVLDFLKKNTQTNYKNESISESSSVIETINNSESVYTYFELVRRNCSSESQLEAFIETNFVGNKGYYSPLSFGDFFKLVNQYTRGLIELGLKSKDKVLFLFPVNIDFFALTLACIGIGAIPVFLDPGMGIDNIKKCIKSSNCNVIFTNNKGQLIKWIWRKYFKNIKFSLNVSEKGIIGDTKLSLFKKYSTAPIGYKNNLKENLDETIFVAYTSGATGTPKGVLYTNLMILTQLQIFENELKLEPKTKNLPLLPIFSIWYLGLRITSVIPPIDTSNPLSLNPNKIATIIEDLKINSSFGSPTLWSKIANYCMTNGIKLNSMKKIYIAGAPVSEKTLNEVQSVLLDDGIVYTPYGSTECLPVCLASSSEISKIEKIKSVTGELGINVGKPINNTKVKIIKNKNIQINNIDEIEELPILNIGEIIVAGNQASGSYLNQPESDNLSKIKDKNENWHRMGDVGYIDENNILYFCGRKNHIVKAEKSIYYSIPIERIFNLSKKVNRSALVYIKELNKPGIVIEPLPQFYPNSKIQKNKFVEELIQMGASDPITSEIKLFFFRTNFPVDARHNAKIFRDKLSDWASQELKRTTQ